jgi:V/A-type H+/Na+-transporting ATPase subunit D
MAKIKLTKGELKKQRDSLKQFRRYLPTLQLKKQQLQMKILESRKRLQERLDVLEEKENRIREWAGLLADPAFDIKPWLVPTSVDLEMVNVAGANVPAFRAIHFRALDYDYYTAPGWVDEGIEQTRLWIRLVAEAKVIRREISILEKELRVTTQRVNLFEKIMIPGSLLNIRKIGIYLGDQQAGAVGIGKVAKKKVEERALEVMAA